MHCLKHNHNALAPVDVISGRSFPNEPSRRTGNDVNKFTSNGGLATTIVLHLEGANHVTGVLGRVVHGITSGHGQNMVKAKFGGVEYTPSTLLASMTFHQGSVDGVGEGELGEILGEVVLHLIGFEAV